MVSPVSIVALVLGVVGVPALVLVVLLRRLRQRATELTAELTAEVAASGERTVLGPEMAVYRGGSGAFSRGKGNCVLALTDRRLVCAKLVGARVEVATRDITGVREVETFLGRAVGGQAHLVVGTRSGDEVGFFVRDRSAWRAAVRPLASRDATV